MNIISFLSSLQVMDFTVVVSCRIHFIDPPQPFSAILLPLTCIILPLTGFLPTLGYIEPHNVFFSLHFLKTVFLLHSSFPTFITSSDTYKYINIRMHTSIHAHTHTCMHTCILQKHTAWCHCAVRYTLFSE